MDRRMSNKLSGLVAMGALAEKAQLVGQTAEEARQVILQDDKVFPLKPDLIRRDLFHADSTLLVS